MKCCFLCHTLDGLGPCKDRDGENHVEKRVGMKEWSSFEGKAAGRPHRSPGGARQPKLKTVVWKPLTVHSQRKPERINARQRRGRSRCDGHCRAQCSEASGVGVVAENVRGARREMAVVGVASHWSNTKSADLQKVNVRNNHGRLENLGL